PRRPPRSRVSRRASATQNRKECPFGECIGARGAWAGSLWHTGRRAGWGAGHSMRAEAGAMTQESHDTPSLGQAVGRGLTWSLGGQIVMRLLSFGTGVVMARLLVPDDFGAFAVALLAVNVLSAVNELGTIPAVVRWKGDPEEA